MKKSNYQLLKEAIKGGFRPFRTLKNLGLGKAQEKTIATYQEFFNRNKNINLKKLLWNINYKKDTIKKEK